jgi:hypothetical protein
VKYLVVRRAGWHEYLLARQPDLVVLGKRTVRSIEPWTYEEECHLGVVVEVHVPLLRTLQFHEDISTDVCDWKGLYGTLHCMGQEHTLPSIPHPVTYEEERHLYLGVVVVVHVPLLRTLQFHGYIY